MKSFITHTATQPTVESLTDYYPFGMAMPGRNYVRNGGGYRYGYTGHEKEGGLADGVYTTQYRLLDTRLGRWLSVDPLSAKYPDMGAYNYCAANPLVYRDPDGRLQTKENGILDIDESDTAVDRVLEMRKQNIPEERYNRYYKELKGDKRYVLGVAKTTADREVLVQTYIVGTGECESAMDYTSNCFGYCFAGGQVWFPTGYEAQIIIEDELFLAPSTSQQCFGGIHTAEATKYKEGDIANAKVGDFVVYYDDKVPYHVAEIKSIDKGSSAVYHKDANYAPYINVRQPAEVPVWPSSYYEPLFQLINNYEYPNVDKTLGVKIYRNKIGSV